MSMPHHESDPAVEKRFIAELLGQAIREYPNGRLGPEDEGTACFAMAYDPKSYRPSRTTRTR